jgi:pimeloyl-ACP methyl ester carboxylesterase
LFLAISGAVVAASVLVWTAYKNDLRHARAAVNVGSQIVRTAAGPIEYAERGVGIPLLSIHGAGGGYDQGLAIAADFVGNGFRVIAPSRFGYLGTSLPSDVSPAAQADAHAALLGELRVEKVVVVGTSAGARSAVEFALRHPNNVLALILIVPGTYAPMSPVAVEASRGSEFTFWAVNAGADFAWWAAEKIVPSVLIRFIGVLPELVDGAAAAERDRVMTMVRSIQPLSRRFPGINIDSTPDLRRPPLEEINAPTLVISARDDLFNTLPAAEFAAGTIPNARLVVYDAGGHLLVGHGQDVREVIRDFLANNGLTAGSPSEPGDAPAARS